MNEEINHEELLYSPHIEQRLLSACMQRPENIQIHGISQSDFAIESHQLIFDAIKRLADHGQTVDCFTVMEELAQSNDDERCGGLKYLGGLQTHDASSAHTYVKICKEYATNRAIAAAGAELNDLAISLDIEPDDKIEAALSIVTSIKTEQSSKTAASAAEAVKEGLEHAMRIAELEDGELLGMPTGVTPVDAACMGLQDGELIVIAGRPSSGKSSYGMQIAEHAASNKKHVLFFSLEMSKKQLILRTIAGQSKVPLSHILFGMSGEELAKMGIASERISKWPLWIDDSPGLSVGKIASRSRRHHIKHGLDLIVIDQLTHINLPGKKEKRDEMGDVTKSLKKLAKDLGIPVVLLHQLRRPTAGTKAGRPDMTMLKDSGAVEEDADVIMLCHRPHYYDPENENPTYAEIVIEKNRMGERGVIECGWAGEYTRFTDKHDPFQQPMPKEEQKKERRF